MQYTDKQIEEAVEKAVVQNPSGTLLDLTRLIMRMVREEVGSKMSHHEHRLEIQRSSIPLPEFWKEPVEAPKPLAIGGLELNKPFHKPTAETKFGGVDVNNSPLTGENKAQGWQPIVTVPAISGPEQCVFIAHTSFCRSGISAFYEQGRWRDANSGAPMAWQPTHWMPIPPLPEDNNG